MRTSVFRSLFYMAMMLCLLFVANNSTGTVVPVERQSATEHSINADIRTVRWPVITCGKKRDKHLFRFNRRRQHFSPSGKRYAGTALLPEPKPGPGLVRCNPVFSLNSCTGEAFVSRIRALLYPKHSFW